MSWKDLKEYLMYMFGMVCLVVVVAVAISLWSFIAQLVYTNRYQVSIAVGLLSVILLPTALVWSLRRMGLVEPAEQRHGFQNDNRYEGVSGIFLIIMFIIAVIVILNSLHISF